MEIDIEYDEAKNADNIERRGLSFEWVRQFDWLSAHIEPDTRRDYGEPRFQATGVHPKRRERAGHQPASRQSTREETLCQPDLIHI